MLHTSDALEAAIEHLSRLPTIGRKTAQRIALWLLKQPEGETLELARAIEEMKRKVAYCSVCWNITESDPCPICASDRRDRDIICVVEEPIDVLAIEKTNDFRGLYHVIGGVINPLDGVGPDDLKIRELVIRVADDPEGIEVIIAMNPSVEGEMTTLYLAKLLRPLGTRITRIASGIPMGSALEFIDEATIARALEGRTVV
jgi:recombination protein RecR